MEILENTSITIMAIFLKPNHSKFWISWWLVSRNLLTMDTSTETSSQKIRLSKTKYLRLRILVLHAKLIFLEESLSRTVLERLSTWLLNYLRITLTPLNQISGVLEWCSMRCSLEKRNFINKFLNNHCFRVGSLRSF